MGSVLRDVERKSGCAHDGPAWIAMVEVSRTGRTVYVDGRALRRIGGGTAGNHMDVETGDIYWVSGVHRDGGDRHRFGRGRIGVDRAAVGAYLRHVGATSLDRRRFDIVDLAPTDRRRFTRLENRTLEERCR